MAGAADFGDGLRGGRGELLVAVEFIVGRIEADAVMLIGGEAEELGGEVFEGVEEFGVAVEEEGDVGTGEADVEDGVRAVGRGGGRGVGRGGWIDLGMHFQGHAGGLEVLSEEMFYAGHA